MTSYIYVIGVFGRDKVVKIGYSADPDRRLMELQVANVEWLELIHKEPVTDLQAPILEKLIHQANRHKTLRGEWFKLSREDAVQEVQFAVIRHTD